MGPCRLRAPSSPRPAPPPPGATCRAAPSCTATTGPPTQALRTLELILTAPVVVASWISLQYYGSTVAPQVFGGGNKLIHNVVGGIGVVEGQRRPAAPRPALADRPRRRASGA